MKITKLFIITMIALLISGCANDSESGSSNAYYMQRQQILDAQNTSIIAISDELSHIRQGCGGDMSKWSPDTIALYKKWQEVFEARTQGRERLIQQINGNTLSETTVNGANKNENVHSIVAFVRYTSWWLS